MTDEACDRHCDSDAKPHPHQVVIDLLLEHGLPAAWEEDPAREASNAVNAAHAATYELEDRATELATRLEEANRKVAAELVHVERAWAAHNAVLTRLVEERKLCRSWRAFAVVAWTISLLSCATLAAEKIMQANR